VIQLLANLRRAAAVGAAFAMLAMRSGLEPARALAQGTGAPTPPPADSTAPPTPPAPPAPSGKPAKKSRAPKLTKAERAARSKVEKEARDQARAEKAARSKSKSAADTSQARAAKQPRTKAPKAAKVAAAPRSKPAKPPQEPKAKPVEKSMEEQRKEDGIYAKRSNWLTFRFGYAKRSGDLTGDGFVGYGVAYQHMMSNKYAFAAGVGHDVVGHFQNELDEAVPFTGEFQRHFKWNTSVRPYVGLGGGYYLRKKYRTASDYNTAPTGGGHVSLGLTSALDPNHVVGFETRVAWLKGRKGIVNPTFGPGEDSETIWTAKLSWGLVY